MTFAPLPSPNTVYEYPVCFELQLHCMPRCMPPSPERALSRRAARGLFLRPSRGDWSSHAKFGEEEKK